MTDTNTYDLIVLGGGMSGLPVALKSAHHGLETALVERDLLGGTCLNRGCIPTKTMIRSAEVAHLARRADEFGVTIDGEIGTDMEAVVERQQRVVESIREGAYSNVEDADELDLIEGRGVFESATELAAGDRTLTADRIVLNTGARPVEPPIDGLDEVDTLDSTSALEASDVPEHLAVVGGGYVGCEFAQMYARFGADVTVFQRGDRLLPAEDPDVSDVIEDAFEVEGIDVQTGTAVEALESTSSGVRATSGDADGIEVSHVLVAAGRRANTTVSASKTLAWRSTTGVSSRSTISSGPRPTRSMRSGTSPARRCSRTRPATTPTFCTVTSSTAKRSTPPSGSFPTRCSPIRRSAASVSLNGKQKSRDTTWRSVGATTPNRGNRKRWVKPKGS